MKRLIIILIFLLGVGLLFGYYYLYYRTPPGTAPPPLSPKHRDLWILVDTSMSMRGYFRTAQTPGTTIQRFLWNGLIPTLRESFPADTIYFSPFGNEIGMPQPINSLLNQFCFENSENLKNTFSGTETRLIEVFKKVREATYRAFVIITDGVPSATHRAGPAPQIVEAVRSLIEGKKQYLWLIGLRSEFEGFVYPECPDEYGKRRPFHFKGTRPIFIWVGAKDKHKGVEVTAKFLERLQELSSSQDFNEVKCAELSFLDLPKAELSFMETNDVCLVYSKDPPEMRILGNREYIDIPLRIKWQKERLEKEKEICLKIIPENFRGASIKNQNGEWYLRIIPRYVSRRLLTINLSIKPRVERWWVDWSTDDDSSIESSNRTLYLEQLVGKFVTPYINKSYNIASIQVIIR